MHTILHLWRTARRVLGALGALGVAMRALRAVWSEADLALLKHLMWLAEPGQVNFRGVVHLFPHRTWQSIKKRCACIRDLARRKARKQRMAVQRAAGMVESGESDKPGEPDSPTSVMALPPAGRLHPALVWVPPTPCEIGPMNLGT